MKLKLVSVASREVIACLDRDPEYDAPYRYSVYLDCVSGRLVTVYERDEDRALDLGGRSEGENRELHEILGELASMIVDENRNLRAEIERLMAIGGVLTIPLPDHRQWHEWFRAFLKWLRAERQYKGSIGQWFAEYGGHIRADWEMFRRIRVVDYANRVAAESGIELEVTWSRD